MNKNPVPQAVLLCEKQIERRVDDSGLATHRFWLRT